MPCIGPPTALYCSAPVISSKFTPPPPHESLYIRSCVAFCHSCDRRDFGDDAEVFRSAVDWQHARLRRAAAAEQDDAGRDNASAIASKGVSANGDVKGDRAGWGTFVVFSSHGGANRARRVLEDAFLPASVAVVAHNRRQGGCFLVHANAVEVDTLLAEGDRFEDESEERSERPFVDEKKGVVGLFEGFVALPSHLKLSPSLLDHGGLSLVLDDTSQENLDGTSSRSVEDSTGSAAAGKTVSLTTTPGESLHGEGLVVMLSPGSVPLGKEQDVADRWRRDWNSGSLDLHGLSFWSDRQQGTEAVSGGGRGYRGSEGSSGGNGGGGGGLLGARAAATAAVLSREWRRAAQMVHALAERRGSTPAEACGWDDVRVAAEGAGLMTLRGKFLSTHSKMYTWCIRFFVFLLFVYTRGRRRRWNAVGAWSGEG